MSHYRVTCHMPDNADPRAIGAGHGTGNHISYFLERLEEQIRTYRKPEFFMLTEICRMAGLTRTALAELADANPAKHAEAVQLSRRRTEMMIDFMHDQGYTRHIVARHHVPMEEQSNDHLDAYMDKMAVVVFTTLPASEVTLECLALSEWQHPTFGYGGNVAVVAKDASGAPILSFVHNSLAFGEDHPMMSHYVRELEVLHALGCPAVGDFNILPVHFTSFGPGGKWASKHALFEWLCGDYLAVPDFRTHDMDRPPTSNSTKHPAGAPVQYRYDVDDEKHCSGLFSTMGQCSRGLVLLDMRCPYKGMPSIAHCTGRPDLANAIFVANLPAGYRPVADHCAGHFQLAAEAVQ